MRNPARSDLCTTQSEAQSVDIVHTPKLPVGSIVATPQSRGVALLRNSRTWKWYDHPDRGQTPVRTLRNGNRVGNLLIHGDNSHFNKVMTESAAAHMTLPGS
jgi:hypothetical protein